MLNNPMRDCVLMIASLTFACDAASLSYSAKPIRATVVDAETGQPIEGVIVDAIWHLGDQFGGWIGAFTVNLTEAVTDTSGTFFMPAWGPLEVPEVPRIPNYPSLRGRLDPNQPELQLFKSGYRFTSLLSGGETFHISDPRWTGDAVRESQWNGKVIKFVRFTGTDAKYLSDLQAVRSLTAIGDCSWVKVPKMTAAFIREGERLKDRYGNQLVRLDEIQERYKGQYCGAPRTIIEELL